jgi:hypothetical protein
MKHRRQLKIEILGAVLFFLCTVFCFDETINTDIDGAWEKRPFTLVVDGNGL